jgi:hypothetical protein
MARSPLRWKCLSNFDNRLSELLLSGEVIDRYPEDKPYPSVLLLGFAKHPPVHVVSLAATRK